MDERLQRFVAAYDAHAGAAAGHAPTASTCAIPTVLRCARRACRARKRGMSREMNKPKDNKNLIVGLDIGTSKIVAMVAEIKPEGGFDVDRLRQPPVARIEEGRGGQHRVDRERDPARAGGSRADGRLQDPRGVHRDRRQPHQELQLARHGGDQGPRGEPDRRGSRDRDRQGGQHSDRPADPAHPQPGIHHRRPGGRARAARHERGAPRGQGAHRHRRRVGCAEHHEVRAPLRPRSRRT